MNYLVSVKNEVSKCIKCGICMAGCPTYEVTKDESMVARGRLSLIGANIDGRLETSATLDDTITSCIGCLTCEVNCPGGVKVGEIIFAAKAQIAENRGLGILGRFMSRAVVGQRWPLSVVIRLSSIPVKIYGLLPERWPFTAVLPFVRKDKKRKLPDTGNRAFTSSYPEYVKTKCKEVKGVVAFFPGCVINFSTQEIGRATVSVLNKLGYDVIIPEGQYCCGIPLMSIGDTETAEKVAIKNIELFSKYDVEAIIISCATCGHTLKKEYPVLLSRLMNGTSEMVRGFSDKVIDIHEFVNRRYATTGHQQVGQTESVAGSQMMLEAGDSVSKLSQVKHIVQNDKERVALGHKIRVTYHDPCHLKKGLGIYESPRVILRSISDAEFVEMDEADACCGFGGIFSLKHYGLSSDIGTKKAESIRRSSADLVATGCPGCKIHIEDSLNRAGMSVRVVHTIELLDKALL
ncbi:MAG: (Fe-S)-binding protein [Nitrospirae bacterium]|nr:(Fe-S)-binding protein [Nitrospirota bacterium]